MKKPRKPLSELQKANLLTGQLLRRVSCTTELVAFLKEYGQHSLALEVERARRVAWDMAHNLGKTAIANAKLAKLLEEKDV